MDIIKEIDFNKYLVLKREDIENELSPRQKVNLATMQRDIGNGRIKKGKRYPSPYLVLNIDDNISLAYLTTKLIELMHVVNSPATVRDIAVDLVNAILKAKGD